MNLPLNIQDFQRVVFFTGAGMSAESGVPTYRGAGGIWKEYDYQRYACQRAFDRDPEGVWEFHNYRRELVAACRPHRGHQKIAELENSHPRVSIVTQNIDGMHQLAGNQRVIELHGSLWRVRHDATGETQHGRDAPFSPQREDGEYWRPDIVWFEDMLNEAVLNQARLEIAQCDLFISIGTSAVVFPAAGLPLIAREVGATLVEINPEENELSGIYSLSLRSAATEALDKLW